MQGGELQARNQDTDVHPAPPAPHALLKPPPPFLEEDDGSDSGHLELLNYLESLGYESGDLELLGGLSGLSGVSPAHDHSRYLKYGLQEDQSEEESLELQNEGSLTSWEEEKKDAEPACSEGIVSEEGQDSWNVGQEGGVLQMKYTRGACTGEMSALTGLYGLSPGPEQLGYAANFRSPGPGSVKTADSLFGQDRAEESPGRGEEDGASLLGMNSGRAPHLDSYLDLPGRGGSCEEDEGEYGEQKSESEGDASSRRRRHPLRGEEKLVRKGSDAQKKHQEWLNKLCEEKRKAREEEEQRKRKEATRRRRRRESLIQRAKQRGEADIDLPIYAKDTTAGRTWKVEKKEEEEELGEEEAARLQKEQYERIAAQRRKQKMFHKKYLAQLIAKRKEQEEAALTEEQKERERRERVKRLAERRMKARNDEERHCHSGAAGGGGLAAVRDRREINAKEEELEEEKEEELAVRIELEKEDKRKRTVALRRAKEKAEEYLVKLRADKQLKEESEQAEQKRQLRRAAILRKRMAQIAAEHKEAKDQEMERKNKSDQEEKQEEDLAQPKMSEEEILASVARLSSKRKNSGVEPESRDFNDWKHKHGLAPDDKVFILTGWYPSVKEALIERGWHQNPDRDSAFFDLKWTLYSADIRQTDLQPGQLCNHYLNNVGITTKAGLVASLRNLRWHAPVDYDQVFPRSYDLSIDEELLGFMDDYRTTAAEGLLKHIVLRAEGLVGVKALRGEEADDPGDGCEEEVKEKEEEEELRDKITPLADDDAEFDDSDIDSQYGLDGDAADQSSAGASQMLSARAREWVPEGPYFPVNPAILEAALAVCRKRIAGMEDSELDDPNQCQDCVTDLQWELLQLGRGEADDVQMRGLYSRHELPKESPEAVDAFISQSKREAEPEQHWTDSQKRERARKTKQRKRQRSLKLHKQRQEAAKLVQTVLPLGERRLRIVKRTLRQLRDATHGFFQNGDFCQNMWIVKPAAKSRGRGIACFSELKKILEYTEVQSPGKHSQWVVQKYIENPLIIARRKFDIRQWVLVTNWNPLTVWYHEDCYLRFGVEEYSTKDSSMGNQYVHLVNNSICKQSELFGTVSTTDNGFEVHQHMWPIKTFQDYLKDLTGRDAWEDDMKPAMKSIAKQALMCAQDTVEHRKDSWELYGYDFMVDDQLKPWLIEINSSPACDYSTRVTEEYVPVALQDLLKVTIDRREWEATKQKKGAHQAGPPPETGGWTCIHEGVYTPTPMAAFGSKLSLKGTALSKQRGSSPFA